MTVHFGQVGDACGKAMHSRYRTIEEQHLRVINSLIGSGIDFEALG